MDTNTYEDLINLVKRAKDGGVACVIVFKPDATDNDESVTLPDMILSSTDKADVIAALLGNSPFDDEGDET